MDLKRRSTVVAVVVAMLVAVVGTGAALGIVYGEPDDSEHPYVGSMVAEVPGVGYFQVCTGTLITPTVFLTAAHCMGIEEAAPGVDILVTFDETISASGTYYAGQEYPHPKFPGPSNNTYDIGVIVLDTPVDMGTYGALPTAGLLDDMKAGHELMDQIFTAVGYGTVRETNTMAWQTILDNVDRNKADQEPLSLTKSWLTLSMNLATGNGGTCYGDSGGPHFLEGTNVIASITITGDVNCKATDKTYRVDTEVARDFLDNFVALP